MSLLTVIVGSHGASDDVLVILAGGVNASGVPHETVMRRLRRAAELYARQPTACLCNGGGTTHKPRFISNGFAVPEAALMGKQLVALGVKPEDVFVEGYSDDTIGNAYFARTMHFDARQDWVSLRVITSEFQMARTKAIYDWTFGLLPLPVNKSRYVLTYDAVEDNGALADRALQSRRRKETASLASFRSSLAGFTHLSQAHDHIFRRHSGYTADGYLAKVASGGGAHVLGKALSELTEMPPFLETY